jgi:hypothetical protein
MRAERGKARLADAHRTFVHVVGHVSDRQASMPSTSPALKAA